MCRQFEATFTFEKSMTSQKHFKIFFNLQNDLQATFSGILSLRRNSAKSSCETFWGENMFLHSWTAFCRNYSKPHLCSEQPWVQTQTQICWSSDLELNQWNQDWSWISTDLYHCQYIYSLIFGHLGWPVYSSSFLCWWRPSDISQHSQQQKQINNMKNSGVFTL